MRNITQEQASTQDSRVSSCIVIKLASILILSMFSVTALGQTTGPRSNALDREPEPFPVEYQLEQTAAWGGPVNTFVKDGNIGYCGSGERLVILDMTDITNLVELGSARMGSTVFDIAVRDGFVYVVTKGLGGFSTEYGIGASAFHVVDVSDPAMPYVVWSNDPATTGGYFYLGREIDLYGDLVFLRGGSGTTAADISDPLNPVMLGSSVVYFPDLLGGGFSEHNEMVIQGDLMYVASRGSLGFFHIYDLSTTDLMALPIQPTLIGSVPFGSNREVTHVTVEGDWAYAAVIDESNIPPGNQHAAEVWAIDVSDPSAPTRMGSYDGFSQVGPGFSVHGINDLSVADGRLYATSTSALSVPDLWDNLTILDVASDPANPALLSTYDTHGSFYGVVSEGDIAYTMDYGEGLIVLDTTDPSAPVQLDNFHSPAVMRVVVKRDDLLYISDTWNGMSIVDVSDPSRPTLVGVYQAEGVTGIANIGLALDDDGYAYLGAGHSGLDIIDVSDPSNPTLVGGIGIPSPGWWVQGVAVETSPAGKTAYLSVQTGNCGNLVFSLDVTNPTSVIQLDPDGLCAGVQGPVTFEIAGPGLLYFAGRTNDDNDGLLEHVSALDCSDPANLVSWGIDASEGVHPNESSTDIALDSSRSILWSTVQAGDSQALDWMQAIDVSDPQNAVSLGVTELTAPGAVAMHPLGLLVVSKAVDFTGLQLNRLLLLDVDDPSSPQLLASAVVPFSVAGFGYPSYSDVVGDETGVYVISSRGVMGSSDDTGLSIFSLQGTTDRNTDGVVDMMDLSTFLEEIDEMSPNADINQDGHTDRNDVRAFLKLFFEHRTGR